MVASNNSSANLSVSIEIAANVVNAIIFFSFSTKQNLFVG